MRGDTTTRQSLVSFLLLIEILHEYGFLGISTHFSISGRFCIVVLTRLCTQMNGHNIHVLGKDRHGGSESLIFLVLVIDLQPMVSPLAHAFTTTATSATTNLYLLLPDTALVGERVGPTLWECSNQGATQGCVPCHQGS